MTKEEFKEYIDNYSTPEEAVENYLCDKAKSEPFWAINTVKTLISIIDNEINSLVTAARVSNERAFYLESFLQGKMYKTREEAEEHVPLQITHAQKIRDVTKKWR